MLNRHFEVVGLSSPGQDLDVVCEERGNRHKPSSDETEYKRVAKSQIFI